MFALNVKKAGDMFMFTIVRPDTSYYSGDRATLVEVYEILDREVSSWNKLQDKRMYA